MSRREADFPGEPKTIGDLMGVTPMTNAPAQPVQGVEAGARCLVTGNPVGTDAHQVGYPCRCANCLATPAPDGDA